MFGEIIIGGIIVLLIVATVTYMAKGFKHGTHDSDPDKNKVLRWFYSGKHPQQKYYKNLVDESVNREEEIEKTIEENSRAK